MTKTQQIETFSVDGTDHDLSMTVKEALERGLIYLKSDLPKTDGRLSRMVEDLVKNTTLSYADIVAKVRAEFPNASTSTKSVASVACAMRKKGIRVPLRLKLNVVD